MVPSATIALIVSAGLAAVMIYTTRRTEPEIDIPTVDEDIRDHVPMRASRIEVESFLDRRGIQHSYVDQMPGRPEDSRTESAMMRGPSNGRVVRRDIQILFRFDDQGRLTHYTLREVLTGP
jgi:hypothetical protein